MSLSSVLVSWLVIVTVVITVSTATPTKFSSKSQNTPLYGVVLYGHPYPKRPAYPAPAYPAPLPTYPAPVYPPPVPSYHPAPPPYRPPAPVYKPPQQPVYQPKPAAPYKPPTPAYKPIPVPSYQPPAAPLSTYQPPSLPAYQATPAPYGVPPPSLPVPTSFDMKPWKPIEDSPSPYVGSTDQLNDIDGYPWTAPLYDEPAIKIPDILFYPVKPSSTELYEDTTDVPYNPSVDSGSESSWRWPSNR